TQTSGGTSNAISVSWTSPGGTVMVHAMNINGCSSDMMTKNVVASAPLANGGPDIGFCSEHTGTIGGASMAGQTYLWSPSTGLSDSTIANPTVTLTNSGSTPYTIHYAFMVTENGCSSTDTVNVTVNPFPVVSMSSLGSICDNVAPFALTAGTPAGGTYSGAGVSGNIFSPALAGPGAHTITYDYMTLKGCQDTAQGVIFVNHAPSVSFSLT